MYGSILFVMQIDIKKILLQKWSDKKLGHFYILKCSTTSWIEDFLLATKASLTSPDILFLSPPKDDENKEYQVEDLTVLFNFLNFKPFELPHRFIVINKSHLMGKKLCNKLLKSLEEPPENLTIFFLCPKTCDFLETIESRAIKINIPSLFPPSDSLLEESPPLLKKGSDEKWEEDVVNFLLKKECLSFEDFKRKGDILEQLQVYETSKTMHNSSQERIFSLLRFLKTSSD